MGCTHCPASGLTIQVRNLPGLPCKSSAVGFAVVRTAAMPSVVLMLPFLNTCTIIIFGLVFLKLFPPYSRMTEKISVKIPAYFLGHPKAESPTPGFLGHSWQLPPHHQAEKQHTQRRFDRDRSGEALRGDCQGIASGVNRKQGGSGMCSQDLCCAWRCFPKKVGQPCHPHKGWCSFL